MTAKILKSFAFSLISQGISLPASFADRYQEFSLLSSLLNLLEINCVIDVGANQGQYAHALRAIGYNGFIVSFEPLKQDFANLVNSFKKDKRWKGYPLALGSENVIGQINVIPESTVMSSLLTPVDEVKNMQVQDVEIKRLDSVFDNIVQPLNNPRVFLKMDTQGYDLEVFKGAEGCLNSILGLQSEISVSPIYRGMPHYIEALTLYESVGFELYSLAVVSRKPDGALVELNCFMRRLNY